VSNHLTPTELARESGLERKEVLSKCVEMGIPVFQGRIDKSLFLASLQGATALPQGATAVPPQAQTQASTRSAASGSTAGPAT
jgi:hypothetical protein